MALSTRCETLSQRLENWLPCRLTGEEAGLGETAVVYGGCSRPPESQISSCQQPCISTACPVVAVLVFTIHFTCLALAVCWALALALGTHHQVSI